MISIGVVISRKDRYSPIRSQYYIVEPFCNKPAMYSDKLYCYDVPITQKGQYEYIINSLLSFFNYYHVKDILAYNSNFDKNNLPELSTYTWLDIANIAAYKQCNPYLNLNDDCYKTGRLKRGYKVEEMMTRITGDASYVETHNALLDAIDELKIVELFDIPFEQLQQFTINPKGFINNPIERKDSLHILAPHHDKDAMSSDVNTTNLFKVNYKAGDLVEHWKFGQGIIEHIEHKKNDYLLTVNFQAQGEIKMYASHVELNKISPIQNVKNAPAKTNIIFERMPDHESFPFSDNSKLLKEDCSNNFQVGDEVMHPEYGKGIIRRILKDNYVKVHFTSDIFLKNRKIDVGTLTKYN